MHPIQVTTTSSYTGLQLYRCRQVVYRPIQATCRPIQAYTGYTAYAVPLPEPPYRPIQAIYRFHTGCIGRGCGPYTGYTGYTAIQGPHAVCIQLLAKPIIQRYTALYSNPNTIIQPLYSIIQPLHFLYSLYSLDYTGLYRPHTGPIQSIQLIPYRPHMQMAFYRMQATK